MISLLDKQGAIRMLALVVLLVLGSPFSGFTASPESLAEKIRDRYAAIDSISFTFSQTTGGQIAGRPRTGKGNALFAKTGDKQLMRWNYLVPDPQVVISDGTTISMYFEKLNQMIITSVDKAQADILFSFFTAEEPLNAHFALLPPDTKTDGSPDPQAHLEMLHLQPLDSDTQIKSIILWIDESALIRRIILFDYFDTKTTINVANIEINPLDLSDRQNLDGRFTFTPPEGTEIIRQ